MPKINEEITDTQRHLRWCSYADSLTQAITCVLDDLNDKSISFTAEEKVRLENLLDMLKVVQRNILCNVPEMLATVNALREQEIKNAESK